MEGKSGRLIYMRLPVLEGRAVREVGDPHLRPTLLSPATSEEEKCQLIQFVSYAVYLAALF